MATDPNGWVKSRRGLMCHTRDGRLAPNYAWAFHVLVSIADAGTGGGVINGPILRYWMGPECTLAQAQRILRFLCKERYIWYRSIAGTRAQPYFVHKYPITKGSRSGYITDLSELFDCKLVRCADVLARVRPEYEADMSDEFQPYHQDTGGLGDANEPPMRGIAHANHRHATGLYDYETGDERRETETETRDEMKSDERREMRSFLPLGLLFIALSSSLLYSEVIFDKTSSFCFASFPSSAVKIS